MSLFHFGRTSVGCCLGPFSLRSRQGLSFSTHESSCPWTAGNINDQSGRTEALGLNRNAVAQPPSTGLGPVTLSAGGGGPGGLKPHPAPGPMF